tara:strand:- start:286 stop:453 length:168 start_codon:yes stop_codon:yes gene_type:complete
LLRLIRDREGAVVDRREVEVLEDFVDVRFFGGCFVWCDNSGVGFETIFVFVLLGC